jgi:hypothetical protein
MARVHIAVRAYVDGSGTLTSRKPKVLTWVVVAWFDRFADDIKVPLSAVSQAAPRVHNTAVFAAVLVHSHTLPVMSKAP